MPEQSIIVWDLETIPDLRAAARMLDMSNAVEADVRQALGEGFPKHPLHKIVCIGALVASRQTEGWRVDALGAPHAGERPEADLIRSFAERVGELRPQLVTWNGHSFDLPVLRYRAMVNRVSAEGLQVRQYFHRYTEDALDLCDVLGSYVPGGQVKLDEVIKILGLPGKPEGVDGSRVEETVRAGQSEEVARYGLLGGGQTRDREAAPRSQAADGRRQGELPEGSMGKPAVLVDAEFRGKTGEGPLRHPAFKGIRPLPSIP
jgi:3'-5' exonuclease